MTMFLSDGGKYYGKIFMIIRADRGSKCMRPYSENGFRVITSKIVPVKYS